jgi:hypothetical protein
MAVTRANNVIKVTANADTITGEDLKITNILYVGGTTSPSVSLKITDTNGMILWTSGTTSDNARLSEQTEIKISRDDTLYVSLAGTGTVVYLYKCTDAE